MVSLLNYLDCDVGWSISKQIKSMITTVVVVNFSIEEVNSSVYRIKSCPSDKTI